MWFRHTVLVSLIALWHVVAPAQVLYELISPNEQGYGRFGSAVALAGDINNDGFNDIVVGANYEDSGSSPLFSGRAYVFSGATGTVLHSLVSPNEEHNAYFGYSVAGAGDVDGDGHHDVIVGALYETPAPGLDGAGRAYVFSGATGSVLHTLSSPNAEAATPGFGVSVAGINDIDNDDFTDIIVGAWNDDPGTSPYHAGRAYVFSGASGDVIYTLVSPNEQDQGHFGNSVCSAGDINGDGFDDIVVGAAFEAPNGGPYEAGRAYVFSGPTGTLLSTLSSPNEEEGGLFGISVSRAGDTNVDGYDDVIVGACFEGSDLVYGGRAYLFSGATGDVLHTLSSPYGDSQGMFGISVSGAGDTNGDGYDDVIVGAGYETTDSSPEAAGRAYVFSGASGDIIYTLISPNEQQVGNFGDPVSGGVDINNDGFNDIAVGAVNEESGGGPENAGRAYVFSGFYIPVELSVFEAVVAAEGIQIRWRTESEHECFGFHLYRQSEPDDGREKVTDQIIPGAGTSSVPHNYTLLDPVTEPGTYRYWLEEVAEDGMNTEYGPVAATIHPTHLTLAGPFPNPVRERAELRLLVPEYASGGAELKLFDLSGRQIGETITLLHEPDAVIHWNATSNDIAPGLYWWQLQTGDESVTKPMIVVR